MKVDSKVILAILKKRWPLIVCGLVVVASIPLGVYYSGQMKESLVKRVQAAAKGDVDKLTSLKTITYSVPATPGTPALESTGAPNQRLIDEFKARRAKQAEDLKQVVTTALEFNASHATVQGREVGRAKRTPLVDGLFPEPRDNDRLSRSNFQRQYIERAHPALLTRYRAGGPPENVMFARALEEYKTQQISLVAGEGKTEQQLAEAELKRVNDAVIAYRIGRQKQRAAELSFYCDLNAFALPVPSDDPPSVAVLWDWQQMYWMREDILAAAAIANREAADIGVSEGVVKRIESIVIDPLIDPKGLGGGGEGFDPAAAPPPAPAEGTLPADFRYSITGRVSGATSGNTFYDVRNATVTAIVSTQRLPMFIDALAQSNFMSVLDLDVARVDNHLEQQAGYFYGTEPVSRVTMVIETIWLRDWIAPTMPQAVRALKGVPDPVPAEQPAGGEATPPPSGGGGG